MKLFLCLCACFLFSGREVRGDASGPMKVDLIHSWKKIKYNNQDEVNMVPTGIAHDYDGWRMYFGVPKRSEPVPGTVTYVPCKTDVNEPMKPFPATTKTLVSVWQPVIDECRRLWVLDVGSGLNEEANAQKPAIIAFDVTNNQTDFPEVIRHEISGTTKPSSFGGFAVDVPDTDKCGKDDPVFIYLPNYDERKLYVLQHPEDKHYEFEHDSFNPTEKTFSGTENEYEDGVMAITLGERGDDGHRIAYYVAGSSSKLWKVSTEVLRQQGTLKPTLIGDRGTNSDLVALSYDKRTKAIFFGEVENRRITCWNTKKPLEDGNVVELYKNDDMKFISDVVIDSCGLLFFMSNALLDIRKPKDAADDIMLFEANATEAVAGTNCAE